MDRAMTADPGRIVRIGGASGFWGDSSVAVPQLVRRANVDYITFDYLAELTMSILSAARAKDPAAGWAKDFVDIALDGMLPEIAARGIRLLTNAGGMNPRACAAALEAGLAAAGVSLRVAVVEGDDLLPALRGLRERGVPVPQQRLVSANAYLGAFPIAVALDRGAQIVITGRCVDSALPLAALIHEFGWQPGDWDRLASGSLAGHILECGAQGSGGLHTDWESVERWDDIGYPIAECAADGTFVITKAPGTGGLVVPAVVAEQLLYEIGDPAAYVLPDVVCDFTSVTMQARGEHRVRVGGARGRPRPNSFKVSATYLDGFRCVGSLVVIGIDAARKARRTAEAILARTRTIFSERGLADYSATNIEIIGAEHTYGPHSRVAQAREVMMRLSVDHADRRALDIFAREIAPAGTSWSPGTTGAGSGRPKPVPLVKFTSFLVPKNAVTVSVEIGHHRIALAPESDAPQASNLGPGSPGPEATGGHAAAILPSDAPILNQEGSSVPLAALAWARSGDKGDTANIGVIARRPEYLNVLREQLTPERVAGYFSHLVRGKVRRFELPGIGAFNFTLEEALGGGGMASMRIDPLAKGMAQMLLDIPIAMPAAFLEREWGDAARDVTRPN
jgi:hypothetical protein